MSSNTPKLKIDDKIANALNVSPTPPVLVPVDSPIQDIELVEEKPLFDDKKLDSDFDMAREVTKDAIGIGQQALDGIYNLASEGDAPRSWEVVATMLQSIVAANQSLVDLHTNYRKTKLIGSKDVPSSSGTSTTLVQNNGPVSVFNGSSKNLLDYLHNQSIISNTRQDQLDRINTDLDTKAVLQGTTNNVLSDSTIASPQSQVLDSLDAQTDVSDSK